MYSGYSGFNPWNCRQDPQGLRSITCFGRKMARLASKEFVLEYWRASPQGPAGRCLETMDGLPFDSSWPRMFGIVQRFVSSRGDCCALYNPRSRGKLPWCYLCDCYSVHVNNWESNVRTLSRLEASDYPSASFLHTSTITFKTRLPCSSLALLAVSKACGTLSRP